MTSIIPTLDRLIKIAPELEPHLEQFKGIVRGNAWHKLANVLQGRGMDHPRYRDLIAVFREGKSK